MAAFFKKGQIRMLNLNVQDEVSQLKAVILGTAKSNGPTPKPEEAYDPKSLEHIKAGTYPLEKDMIPEMEAFKTLSREKISFITYCGIRI